VKHFINMQAVVNSYCHKHAQKKQ